MTQRPITFDRFVRGLMLLMCLGGIVMLMSYLSHVLLPFFVAWFAAYLLYPVVTFFQYRLRLRSRVLSIMVTFALIVGMVWGFITLTLPSIQSETAAFRQSVEAYMQDKSVAHQLPGNTHELLTHIAERIGWDNPDTRQELLDAVRAYVPKVWQLLWKTAGAIMTLISSCIALLYFFFLLVDYEKMTKGIRMLLPHKHRTFFENLLNDLERGMNNYFRGQALISISVGVLFSVGLLIIDFPLAIPLGLLIGALSFVPYLHSLGLLPIVVLSLFKSASTGDNYWIVLASALAVFLVVQAIQDLILTPRIMGNAVGLPPFMILLSLSVWGYALGIIGMIIALPITTLIISYFRRYIAKTQ